MHLNNFFLPPLPPPVARPLFNKVKQNQTTDQKETTMAKSV